MYSNEEIENIRNSKKTDRRVYKSRKIKDFRDLVFYSIQHDSKKDIHEKINEF